MTRPTLTGDDLALCMADTLITSRADLDDPASCILVLVNAPPHFLAKEINPNLDKAMALARGMRAEAREAA